MLTIYDRRGDMEAWLAGVRRSLAEELRFDAFIERYERCFVRTLESRSRSATRGTRGRSATALS